MCGPANCLPDSFKDTEHCDLPTEVVPIYLLAFLHTFELLGWQELGQATGAHSVTWIRTVDLLTLQPRGFLQFNMQHHHVPLAALHTEMQMNSTDLP